MNTFVIIYASICVTLLFCGGLLAIFNWKKSKYAKKNDDKVSMRAYNENVDFGLNMLCLGWVGMGSLVLCTVAMWLKTFIYI
ncbi:hypothetical protein AB1J99_31460 [Bacillus bombysepticus]